MSTTLDAKDPDVPATYTIDWHDRLVSELARNTGYPLNAVVRPPLSTGWYYRCTVAGRSAAHRPSRMPRISGEVLQDGSATFVAVHPDDAAVPTVLSASWTVPSGLELDSEEKDSTTTSATFLGGTDGQDYSVTCRMSPSAGKPVEQTIVVPVRSQ